MYDSDDSDSQDSWSPRNNIVEVYVENESTYQGYIISLLNRKLVSTPSFGVLRKLDLLTTKRSKNGEEIVLLDTYFQTELVGYIIRLRNEHRLEVPDKYNDAFNKGYDNDIYHSIDDDDEYFKYVKAVLKTHRYNYSNNDVIRIEDYGIAREVEYLKSLVVFGNFEPLLHLIAETESDDRIHAFMSRLGYYREEEEQFRLMMKETKERLHINIPGIKCSNCGATDVHLDIAQVRAKDEGMTLFITCNICKNRVTA